jgi:hypothetical protein
VSDDDMDAMMAAGLLDTVRKCAHKVFGETQVYPCDDVKRMADRIEALERERDALFRRATLAEEWRDHDRNRALSARREALEEAARVADRLVDCDSRMMHGAGMIIASTQIAHAIRALKER